MSLLLTMGAIFPGAGQFVQKRWVSGITYALGSVVSLIGFLIYMLRFFFAYYSQISWDGSETGVVAILPHVLKMLICLGIAILVWIASTVDLYFYQSRGRRSALRASMLQKRMSPPPL